MRLTPETIQPVAPDRFPLDGRGPALQRAVYYTERGTYLQAIEYHNNEYPVDPSHLKHVRIVRAQVVMRTPHEVINYRDWAMGFLQHRGAGALDLGRSDWLSSFSPLHLSKCRHFQLLFYDDLFDIICEGLEFGDGAYEVKAYPSSGANAASPRRSL